MKLPNRSGKNPTPSTNPPPLIPPPKHTPHPLKPPPPVPSSAILLAARASRFSLRGGLRRQPAPSRSMARPAAPSSCRPRRTPAARHSSCRGTTDQHLRAANRRHRRHIVGSDRRRRQSALSALTSATAAISFDNTNGPDMEVELAHDADRVDAQHLDDDRHCYSTAPTPIYGQQLRTGITPAICTSRCSRPPTPALPAISATPPPMRASASTAR